MIPPLQHCCLRVCGFLSACVLVCIRNDKGVRGGGSTKNLLPPWFSSFPSCPPPSPGHHGHPFTRCCCCPLSTTSLVSSTLYWQHGRRNGWRRGSGMDCYTGYPSRQAHAVSAEFAVLGVCPCLLSRQRYRRSVFGSSCLLLGLHKMPTLCILDSTLTHPIFSGFARVARPNSHLTQCIPRSANLIDVL